MDRPRKGRKKNKKKAMLAVTCWCGIWCGMGQDAPKVKGMFRTLVQCGRPSSGEFGLI